MKILLINPPAENTIIADNPSIIDEERGYNPPLGLLYIAGYVEKATDYEVDVLDTQVEEIGYDRLGEVIRQKKPDVVGISAMTFTLIDALHCVKIVKEISRNIPVVLGGPHVHIYPYETINLPGVDFVVMGEGEITFANLVQNLHRIDRLRDIPGLVFKDKQGNIVNTGHTNFISELDTIPFPARHLTPYQKYSSLLAKRQPITTMMTSRGCPYRCLYCDRPHMGKVFRARTAQNVVDEMEECVRLGIKEILVYDDTFTVNRQRVIDICEEIIKRKLDIGWDIRARIDTVDKEMLKRLRKARCERIHLGVEAGTEKILKVLRKGITIAQVKEAFKTVREAGFSILAYFMIGSPEETREDILATIDFAKKLAPDFVSFTITTPYPATDLYFQGLQQGILQEDSWKKFAEKPTTEFQTQYWEENLSREELLELLEHAYKSFYLRPQYIIKKLLQVRSVDELRKKVRAGIRVIQSNIA